MQFVSGGIMSNILAIRAETKFTEDLNEMLQECGCDVTTVADHAEAQKTVLGKRIQILVLEWGPNGNELSKALISVVRKNHRTRRIHIIAVSENRTPEMLAEAMNATVNDYFSWPVSIYELRSRLLWAANRFEQLV